MLDNAEGKESPAFAVPLKLMLSETDAGGSEEDWWVMALVAESDETYDEAQSSSLMGSSNSTSSYGD